nr:glycoside hydrolase family 38 C-terminal domain-containing protein [Candidatus Njordarchaeota archaeon]
MSRKTKTRKGREKKKFTAILVSHTHWDREWYSSLYVFRKRLVKMVDNLLATLENEPKFTRFTLDGQVIPIEDYLEVRPEHEVDIRKYVKEGRIAIGPSYVLPDNFLVSGEAHIRNLLLGMRIAEELGKVMKVGYFPDAFGQISQMPQILRGFGIDTAVFTRGVGNEGDRLNSEFIWRAPDGTSSVLAHWLVLSYGNLVNVSPNLGFAFNYVTRVANMLKKKATTNNVLLMNGSDHLEAQPHIPLVVDYVNKNSPDWEVRIGSPTDYFELIKAGEPSLQVFEGEFRSSKFHPVLTGVTSTRVYLKQANVETQTLLEKWVEPFDVWAWSLGERHNQGLIWQAWKLVLQCHPHDSICGCGIDWIHDDMMRRFGSAQHLGTPVLNNDLSLIASRINLGRDDYAIVVFNPLNWSRTDVVETTIFAKKSTDQFEIADPDGKPATFDVIGERMIGRTYSRKYKEKVLDVVILAEDVPPCGYKTYQIRSAYAGREGRKSGLVVHNDSTVENEFFKIKIQENGSITLTDKRSGTVYEDLSILQDGGEVGDEYNYDPPKQDKIYTSRDTEAHVTILERGLARCTLKVEYNLTLPASATEDRKTRASNLVSCPVTCYISLHANVPRVDFKLEFENNAKDHRLRVLFPTGIRCDHSYADQAFHVIRRPLELPSSKGWVELPVPTQPMQSFASAGDGKKGIAVATRGLQEYEVAEDGVVAVTLLRCVGWLSQEELSIRPGAGPIISTPGAQCLGKHIFHYSVVPYSGTWETAKVYLQALQHQTPMKTVQVVEHEFAVAGELVIVPGEFTEPVTKRTAQLTPTLPLLISFLSVEPNNILLSAVKRAEDGNGIIVRVYNTTDEKVEGKLRTYVEPRRCIPVNMREEPLKEEMKTMSKRKLGISFEAPPFRIRTFKLVFPGVRPTKRER